MSLEQLEKKLYKPGGGEELEKEREEKSEYDPKFSAQIDSAALPPDNWKELPPGFFNKHKKTLAVISGVLIFVIAVAFGFILYQRSRGIFDKEKITLTIDGPKTITSGDSINYSITYLNETDVDLLDAELAVVLPKNLNDPKLNVTQNFSKNIKIGTIEKKSQGKIQVSGRLIGSEKSIHYTETILSYKPANVSSKFETNAKFSTTIKNIPIQFSINAPQQAYEGEQITYTFDMANNIDNSVNNIEIKWDLPDGFTVLDSDPTLDKDNIAKIALLKSKETKQIKITGTLSGNIDDIKIVKATLSQNENGNLIVYGEDQAPTKIAASYISITQTINESGNYIASPGEELHYRVNYKNNTDLGIGGLTVRAKLEEKLLDFKTLNANGGSFDATTGTITWKGTDAPKLIVLPPREQGEIEFSVTMKSKLPINNFSDKNFTMKSAAEIESREVPTQLKINKIFQSNETTVKISSKLFIQAIGYYDEPTALIKNSGSVPPQVNQTTNYTIHWRIINLTNDLKNVKLTSSLPANTKWTNQTTTNNNTNIFYNEGTNEITWDIDNVPANTGIISPTVEGIFQVALTPPPNQVGSSPDILNTTETFGVDTFTNANLIAKADSLNTEIPSDGKYKGKGEVIE